MDGFHIRFLSDVAEQGLVSLEIHHDAWLVLLSYLIASAGSLSAFSIIHHLTSVRRLLMRRIWIFVGSLCLGGGIWSMHFIGMLAMKAPIALRYDLPVTLLSLMVALAASGLAILYMSQPAPHVGRKILAASIIGLGIAAMHYCGMAAIRSQAQIFYVPGLFALSILIAVSACFAALQLATLIRTHLRFNRHGARHVSALVMGGAITSMHFTGMAAMRLMVPQGQDLPTVDSDHTLHLVLIVAMITLAILGGSVIASWVERKLEAKERDLQRVNALLRQLDHAKASLEQAAHYDALSELLNRRGFTRVFAAVLQEHQFTGRQLAIMFLDIDHFKRVNDTLGHDAGDQLLKVVAQRIRGALRGRDLVARFGGDEFCVAASLDASSSAQMVAQRLLDQIKQPINLEGRVIIMTTSIGISIYPQDGETQEELLKHADLALYESKGSGRNALHFFNPNLRQKATLALQLEEDLRHSLQRDSDLLLHYQPIIDLATGRMTKVEALVRWQHPKHGLLSPDRFIGIAEANGFIDLLDDWVMRQACKDLRQLNNSGYTQLRLGVNCSALNLTHDHLPKRVEQLLEEAGCHPNQFDLEVTESALLSNINRAIDLLDRIRQLGVTLSIDDFGTGYSSLAYLRRLPLDTLKIDRSFIQDVVSSAPDREIVNAIIAMAHALHLKVVAEGVETSEQLELLRQCKCDQVQGYLISKPVELSELMRRFPANAQPLGAITS